MVVHVCSFAHGNRENCGNEIITEGRRVDEAGRCALTYTDGCHPALATQKSVDIADW